MFDVNINFKEISISSMEKEDVKELYHWSVDQKVFLDSNNDVLEFNELYQRFLEYYISECEVFLKIMKKNNLIGIFKGRIEFKNPNIVWISCFTLEHQYLENDEGNAILSKILSYFCSNFGICNFLSGVAAEDEDILSILKHNGFQLERISNEFFMENGKMSSAFILKKKNNSDI